MVAIVPVKCGLNMKYFKSGLVQIETGHSILRKFKINHVKLTLIQISEDKFKEGKKKMMVKVFFKGFPFQTKKSGIKTFFSAFGLVEYIYFMCAPKKSKHPCRMGYIIFDSRESAEQLLNHKEAIYYGKSQVTVEEYRTNRKHTNDSIKGLMTAAIKNPSFKPREGVHITMSFNELMVYSQYRQEMPSIAKHSTMAAMHMQGYYTNSKNNHWLASSRDIGMNSLNYDNIRFNILTHGSADLRLNRPER